MIRRPPRSTRTDTLFPYTTLFRSTNGGALIMLSRLARVRTGLMSENQAPVDAPNAQPLQALRRQLETGSASLNLDDVTIKLGHSRLRSEEHTSELQSLMRNSYAVFCLKKKQNQQTITTQNNR